MDADDLRSALAAWDVRIFASGQPGDIDVPPAQLISSLAQAPSARLRTSLTLLFLRHPEIAVEVPGVVEALPTEAAETLRLHYTAAVYLQQLWRTRLAHALPGAAELPDYFSVDLGLPAPTERHGKVGLVALTARSRYNLMASYDKQVELLFWQLEHDALPKPTTAA